MNQPTPAIVAQDAVRRLPRVALLLFCLAYVVPGFVGREPWKNADITAFGYMFELARGVSDWMARNSQLKVTDIVVTQSSDEAFHCIAITVFYWEDTSRR